MTNIYLKNGIFLSLLFVSLLFISNAGAHGTENKELISPADLSAQIAELNTIDIRTLTEYTKGHVPGALSLPLAQISQEKLKSLGVDSSQNIVVYASSETPAKKAKLLLEVLGFTKVRILAGGFAHYVEDKQPVETGPPIKNASTDRTETASSSMLEIVPASHDFGIITGAGGIVSTTFKVKNNGSDSVKITEITTSCGCTSAEIDKTTIAPDGSSSLEVHFNPNFHKEPEGKFSRTIFLQTSEGLEIQAKIYVEIAK